MKTKIALLLALAIGLCACSTTTPDPAKNARNAGLNAAGTAALNDAAKIIGSAAMASLFNVANSELSGGKVDYGQAAVAGLYSQVNGANVSSLVYDTVNAFSGGKAKQTAAAAAKAASSALANGADPTKIAPALAEVISTATGAPPAK